MDKKIKPGKRASLVVISFVMIIGLCFNMLGFPSTTAYAAEPEAGHQVTIDFTANGESFTDVRIGDLGGEDEILTVSDNFNLDELTEFYVTKIVMADRTYTFNPGEYSIELKDDQDRDIFDTRLTKISDSMARLWMESHKNDIKGDDIAVDKTIDDYCDFMITNLCFVKESFRGVLVATTVSPDHYDSSIWNGVDLNDTSEDAPGDATAYYGEDTVTLQSVVDSPISDISLVDNGIVPSDAIIIDNEDFTITFLSNFYNYIPIKVTLEDGTVGYINITRIGIFITSLNAGDTTLYHGGSREISDNFDVQTDKKRIAATFYHENSTTYDDYDLIVTFTYADGSTEIAKAQGVGDIDNAHGDIIGSDYLLWAEEDGGKRPSMISVTAVNKGALDNANTFGGAQFGSGAGVEWEYGR